MIALGFLITVILAVLKFVGVVTTLSWLQVLVPLGAGIAVTVLVAVAFYAYARYVLRDFQL